MAAYRPATPSQAALLEELTQAGHLVETGVAGVYGQGAGFERVRDAFTAAVGRVAGDDPMERLSFPPLLSREQLETNGYLGSFPHLAGSIFSFEGSETQAREQEAIAARHEDWSAFQSMTDLVILPAACYPVYPEIARRGALPRTGLIVDTGSAWVFRNEASGDPARMRIFHMREFVRIGDPVDVAAFRNRWLERTRALFARLGLETTTELASDPFFGRVGKMLAVNQVEQELKFEILAGIGGPEPTAIASFNDHQDHFTSVYGLALDGGGPISTGCVAFGIERVTLALFRAHGMDVGQWPAAVAAELWP